MYVRERCLVRATAHSKLKKIKIDLTRVRDENCVHRENSASWTEKSCFFFSPRSYTLKKNLFDSETWSVEAKNFRLLKNYLQFIEGKADTYAAPLTTNAHTDCPCDDTRTPAWYKWAPWFESSSSSSSGIEWRVERLRKATPLSHCTAFWTLGGCDVVGCF